MLPPGLPPPGTGLCPRPGGAPPLLVPPLPRTLEGSGARRGPRVAAPLRVPRTPEPQHRPPGAVPRPPSTGTGRWLPSSDRRGESRDGSPGPGPGQSTPGPGAG